MTTSLPWYLWFFLLVIFALQVTNLVRSGLPAGGSAGGGAAADSIDFSTLKASAQTNITIIMVISTVFLALAAYYFLSQNPAQERPYVMLMLHASIFISTISASMAIMSQLSAV